MAVDHLDLVYLVFGGLADVLRDFYLLPDLAEYN